MCETMVFWRPRTPRDRATEPDLPPHTLQYARDWQAAEKIVYSTTLESVSSAKARIERTFEPDAVRTLKAAADHDLTIDGPNLAAQAIAAGLVDEYPLFITTSVVGGGKRFFADGVRLARRAGRSPRGLRFTDLVPRPHDAQGCGRQPVSVKQDCTRAQSAS
jgi:riboflavin biosynthesis pyrimidine reductase